MILFITAKVKKMGEEGNEKEGIFLEKMSEEHLLLLVFSFLCDEDTVKSRSRRRNRNRWTASSPSTAIAGIGRWNLAEEVAGDTLQNQIRDRGTLRLVCKSFDRVMGLKTESIYVPCAQLCKMIPPSTWFWTTTLPRLCSIDIDCCKMSECEGLIEVLLSESKLPLQELISDSSKKLATADDPKPVGINVSANIVTKSMDGTVAIQGLLKCLSRCCDSSLYLRSIDISETSVTDDCLLECFTLLPCLKHLDLRRCTQLERPFRDIGEQCFLQCISTILVDGCWQLDMSCVVELEQLVKSRFQRNIFIDIIHEELPSNVEVVILTPPWRGNWVRCTVTNIRDNEFNCGSDDSTNYCRAMYDIFVWETLHFDHAVGYSGMPAFEIQRQHLRVGHRRDMVTI